MSRCHVLIPRLEAPAGSTVLCLARIKQSDGTYLTADETSSVRVDVYDDTDDRIQVDVVGEEVSDGTPYEEPEPEEVVSDDLEDWHEDSVGRNVLYKFTTPEKRNHVYEVRLRIMDEASDTFVAVWQIVTR